jgi:hypothetical protein
MSLHSNNEIKKKCKKESAKGEIIFREKTDLSRSALHVDQNRPPLLLIRS